MIGIGAPQYLDEIYQYCDMQIFAAFVPLSRNQPVAQTKVGVSLAELMLFSVSGNSVGGLVRGQAVVLVAVAEYTSFSERQFH